MKIVYMGTPDFSILPLEEMIKAGHEILLVVTQPDKPKGRGKELSVSPVKEIAIKYGLPLFQPAKIKTPEAVEVLKNCNADLFVVAAYGQILSKEILEIPTFGCINIHASLLPKYRGAAPIQWAIVNGEVKTGVTLQQMDIGMDTGDMLAKAEVELDGTETGESLFESLKVVGAKLLIDFLPEVEKRNISPIPQKEEEATYAPIIKKEMGRLDWNKNAVEIERMIRGFYSWPGTYTFLNNKKLKISKSRCVDVTEEKERLDNSVRTKEKNIPGKLIKAGKDKLFVICGSGIIEVLELQPEGKRQMSSRDFLAGYTITEEDILQ